MSIKYKSSSGKADHTSKKESTTDNYLKDFDPRVYLEKLRNDPNEDKKFRFSLDGLHEVFSGGKCFGKRLLDLGSGPSIHSVISASRHYDEIYLSDYVPQNLSILADWWTGKISHMDHAIMYCLDMEHNSQTVAQRNQEMRQKIKGILQVDVRKSNPFSPNHLPPFDAIISSFCVDSATTSLEDYDNATSNIPAMLTENGTYIFTGAMDKTYYSVGGVNFKYPTLSKNDIYQVHRKHGLVIEMFKEFQNEDIYDGTIFMAVARKAVE
ncbi:hypothetical protein ScPMuIL_016928 [Solemya velum]